MIHFLRILFFFTQQLNSRISRSSDATIKRLYSKGTYSLTSVESRQDTTSSHRKKVNTCWVTCEPQILLKYSVNAGMYACSRVKYSPWTWKRMAIAPKTIWRMQIKLTYCDQHRRLVEQFISFLETASSIRLIGFRGQYCSSQQHAIGAKMENSMMRLDMPNLHKMSLLFMFRACENTLSISTVLMFGCSSCSEASKSRSTICSDIDSRDVSQMQDANNAITPISGQD